MKTSVVERRFNFARLHKSFDHRAKHFVAADFFLREIASRMRAHLDLIKLVPERILDIGCARGGAWPELKEKYPQAQLFGLDWSREMLVNAKPRLLKDKFWQYFCKHPTHCIQADWSQLPIAPASVDLIWANLALQWAALPNQILIEWSKILRSEGLLILSTLGPDSLKELRLAFTRVDMDMHIADFVDMHDWGDMLVHCGLSDPVVDAETLKITYETPQALLQDIRRLGVYPGIDSKAGLRGRQWQQRLYQALEEQRAADGLIYLSMEVVYAHAWKLTVPSGRVDQEGIARLRPEDIGYRRK